MDAHSQLWTTDAMEKPCEGFGKLFNLADLCAVGMTYQSHLTVAKLAFVTDEP